MAQRKALPPDTVNIHCSSFDDPSNYKVVELAQQGFHIDAIARHTGKTYGQVSYRIRMAGIRLRDYRDGMNEHSRRIMDCGEEIMFTPKERSKLQEQYEENRIRILKAMARARNRP